MPFIGLAFLQSLAATVAAEHTLCMRFDLRSALTDKACLPEVEHPRSAFTLAYAEYPVEVSVHCMPRSRGRPSSAGVSCRKGETHFVPQEQT